MRAKTPFLTLSAALAATLVLSACGGDSSDGSKSSGASGGGGDENVTLTVATFNEFGYEDLFKEYMDDHPNVKIEHRKAATSDEARDNLNTRLAAGSGLSDIEAVEVDWLPELLQYSDKFNDLTSDDIEGRWLDWKTAAATDQDDRLIGYGTDIGPEGVCYRADLFEKAGMPTDRDEVAKMLEGDWDKYFEVGKQFTDKTDIPWFDSGEAMFQGMINQLDNAFEQSDGTPIPMADNAQIKDIYDSIMKQLPLSAHYSQWSEDWTASFQDDGFATMLCPGWMLGVIEGNASGVEGWDRRWLTRR